MEIDRDLIRWTLLIGAAPLWWPFLRTLWRDFNDALREEGGLLGRPPSPLERERMRAERAGEPPTLPSEPFVRPGQRRRTRLAAGPRARPGSGTGAGKPAARPTGPPARDAGRRRFR